MMRILSDTQIIGTKRTEERVELRCVCVCVCACVCQNIMATFPFNLHSSTSAYNLDDIRGAMCDVYEQGMLIPSAVMATNTINQTMLNTHTHSYTIRFKNLCAPSRHSGDSSLSLNEPNNSLTRISAYIV